MRWLATLAVAAAVAGPAQAERALDDPDRWLERIARSARMVQYHGEVVYRHGDRVEAMEIVRRGGDDNWTERLLMLDGVPREVLRDGKTVTCILPGGRESLAGHRIPRNPFPGEQWAYTDAVARHYDFLDLGSARIAGRACKVIGIQPRDALRYGFRLWVDESTGLVLRSDIVDADGEVVEQAAFTRIRYPDSIDDRQLQPSLEGETLRWPVRTPSAERPSWRLDDRPAGFDEKAAHPHQFSDGLATVSVFVNPVNDDKPGLSGTSRMGAVSAFGTVIDGFQVTIVGEVPTATVQAFGEALRLTPPR